jgi:hypothetical protein
MGQLDHEWSFVRMGASAAAGKHGGRSIPDSEALAMRGNPFLNFHRAAEAAGYPALLIVSAVCLGLVVAPVALLGLTEADWVLALALLSLAAALAILAGAIDAAMSDYGEPPAGRTGVDAAASKEREPVAPLRRRRPSPQGEQDRKAA